MAFQPMANQRWVATAGGAAEDLALSSAGGAESRAPPAAADSDLSCTEDGWDKESPSSKNAAVFPRGGGCSRLPTSAERAQLRRARPVDASSAAGAGEGEGAKSCSLFLPITGPSPWPKEAQERMDGLHKMFRAQWKFLPEGVTGSGRSSSALCRSKSPFVAERRGLFVAWENQMATFLGYSKDTVAVALNYFDRYTCSKACSPTVAQAVAATALHVAAKFEETEPASLRRLLKFTPVFAPEHLLRMEMSLIKELKWDLRPVTVYDFVRSFCDLLVPRGNSPATVAAATAASGGSASPSQPSPAFVVTLESKEKKKKELERLRIGAEDIADLALFDVCFVDFLPSTLATSALLLSVARGTGTGGGGSAPRSSSSSSFSLPPTSIADVLDLCRKGVSAAAAEAALGPVDAVARDEDKLGEGRGVGAKEADDGGGSPCSCSSLRSVLECVELLGSSLCQRFPAVAVAAKSASKDIALYAGFSSAAAGGGSGSGDRGNTEAAHAFKVATTPVAVSKGRRCSTPTGVDGIVHIEMDAIRSASGGSGDNSTVSSAGGDGAAVAATATATTAGRQQPRRRPTPLAMPAAMGTATSATAAAAAPEQQQPQRHQQQWRQDRRTAAGSDGGGSFSYTEEEIAFARASKKRSAKALRHSESGSGFGPPATRRSRMDGGPASASACGPAVSVDEPLL